jgi:hypothetical protein
VRKMSRAATTRPARVCRKKRQEPVSTDRVRPTQGVRSGEIRMPSRSKAGEFSR